MLFVDWASAPLALVDFGANFLRPDANQILISIAQNTSMFVNQTGCIFKIHFTYIYVNKVN